MDEEERNWEEEATQRGADKISIGDICLISSSLSVKELKNILKEMLEDKTFKKFLEGWNKRKFTSPSYT